MPYEETWIKARCPVCKSCNWLCEGDMQDCTTVDTEAIECWLCNHQWWRDPDNVDDIHGFDEDTTMDELKEYLNDHAEKGREAPR